MFDAGRFWPWLVTSDSDSTACQLPDRRFQLLEIHRLCQVCFESCLFAFGHVLLHSKAGESQGRHFATCSDTFQQLESGAVWQPNIEQEQIKFTSLYCLNSGRDRARRLHFVILDNRIVTKPSGRAFLRALPEMSGRNRLTSRCNIWLDIPY
jgi:hypothetical protein